MSLTNKFTHTLNFVDALTRKTLTGAGGGAIVCAAGTTRKATLYDPDNGFASLANPVEFKGGQVKFAVDNSINEVDVYGFTPGGQSFTLLGVVGQSQPFQVPVLTAHRDYVAIIPFHPSDYPAATTTVTGLVEPAAALWRPFPAVNRTVAEGSARTIAVGRAGANTGFIDGLDINGTGIEKTTLANSGTTLGTLLQVQSGGSAGDDAPEHAVSAGNAINITPAASYDTAQGRIHLPYYLGS